MKSLDFNFEMYIPLKFQDMNLFCQWVIKTALKPHLEPRVINNMGPHKWWILRDFSNGKLSPENYVMFVNINFQGVRISAYNTVIISWNPIPFRWGFWEKIYRKLKQSNYPKIGDILQIISVNGGTKIKSVPFNLIQLTPEAYPSEWSRLVWNRMEEMGWTLVFQGETPPVQRINI